MNTDKSGRLYCQRLSDADHQPPTLSLVCALNLRLSVSRSASKLQTLLLEREIPQSTLEAHLTIVEGDVREQQSVSRTLSSPPKSTNGNGLGNPTVQLIISGIGRPPIFTPNPLNPKFDDPTICKDAITVILSALRSLPSLSQKPVIVALSTTGISSKARDVPMAMLPLYHWLLAVPHKDKKEMEAVLLAEMTKPAQERAIENFVIVRPSLLTDGKRLGTDKVRVGEEGGEGAKPAVGYTIGREDVGGWMFDEMVKGAGAKKYAGKMVSITY